MKRGGQLFLYRELSLNEVTACQRLHEDGILAEGHLEEAIIRRALLWPEHSNPSDPSDYYFSKLPAGVPTQLAQAILSASDPRIRPVGTDSDENPLENELLLATNKWEQDPFGKEINAVMELIPGLQPSVLRQLSIRQLYDLLALHQLISSQTEKTPSRTATPLPDIPNPPGKQWEAFIRTTTGTCPLSENAGR